MPEIARIVYGQTQKSVTTDSMGMRQMQRKVYDRRSQQYILLKAPPASGKSRAFMFIALDKMRNQGLKKTIIAVPERSIGASFKTTKLSQYGFFDDWTPADKYNLCYAGGDNTSGKVKAFVEFVHQDKENILICTHATLRFAFDALHPEDFNGIFLGIDEFHHASADTDNSRLGELVKDVINGSTAHIMAMTGSYFRGDGIPVLEPEVEQRFTSVIYNYYDQLSGYQYLHAITLSYEFYQGTYFKRLQEVLNSHRKTIIHIPNVNSLESTGEKYTEVDRVIGCIGDPLSEDSETGVLIVKTADGRMLKVIDLVDDDGELRRKRQKYLQLHSQEKDAIDIILALNLAKEGFDWPACENMLTIGYRGSLTEIVQIIGRCTRDYPGKSEAFFTNLIAEPDASNTEVVTATNDLLKAITASLLMEEVLLPKWNFKSKLPKLKILEPETQRAKDIIDKDYEDLVSNIMTNPEVEAAIPKKNSGNLINKLLIPKIIIEKYPDLSAHDVEAVRQAVVANIVLNSSTEGKSNADRKDVRLLHFANEIVLDVRELDINLIDSVNPFESAYQVLSKSIDKATLASVRDALDSKRHVISEPSLEDVTVSIQPIKNFCETNGRAPDRHSDNPYEAKLGEILFWLKKKERERTGGKNN